MKFSKPVYYLLTVFTLLYFSLIACQQTAKQPTSSTKTKKELSHKDCIEAILIRDDSLGSIRNHACEKISLALTIQHYADSLASLDYTHCPTAFAQAFEKHWTAWRAMIPLVQRHPKLRGEMHDLFDQIKMTEDSVSFNPLLKEIWDTWAEVENAKKI